MTTAAFALLPAATTFALLSTVAHVGDAALERIAAAARVRLPQLDAAWEEIYSELQAPASVRIVSSTAELRDSDTAMVFTATIDDPNALAYHSIQAGVPYGLILASADRTPAEIEEAALHEILECRLDPSCDLYADGVAIEACDPLQGDIVPIYIPSGAPVVAPPFVLPGYFPSFHAAGATNSAGFALAPLDVRPGGYFQRADGSQEFGMRYVEPAHKWHHHSRPSRRRRARLARGASA